MLLSLWAGFWSGVAWVPPVVGAYWNALTGQSGLTGGGDIGEI